MFSGRSVQHGVMLWAHYLDGLVFYKCTFKSSCTHALDSHQQHAETSLPAPWSVFTGGSLVFVEQVFRLDEASFVSFSFKR